MNDKYKFNAFQMELLPYITDIILIAASINIHNSPPHM